MPTGGSMREGMGCVAHNGCPITQITPTHFSSTAHIAARGRKNSRARGDGPPHFLFLRAAFHRPASGFSVSLGVTACTRKLQHPALRHATWYHRSPDGLQMPVGRSPRVGEHPKPESAPRLAERLPEGDPCWCGRGQNTAGLERGDNFGEGEIAESVNGLRPASSIRRRLG